MEFHLLPGAAHQGIRHGLVVAGELEHVGTHVGVGDTDVRPAAETGLDEAAFISLENITLQGELVKFSCLHSVPEHEVELEETECCQGDNEDGY